MLAITLFISKLNHPHFVKFYGTAVVNENDDVKAILVMELCKGNLQNYFESNQTLVPGRSANRKHVPQAFKWVIEICSALDYIHNERVVHRDLTLEKILVRNKEKYKQTNTLSYQSPFKKLRTTETKRYSMAWVEVLEESIRPLHSYIFLEAIYSHVYAVRLDVAKKQKNKGH